MSTLQGKREKHSRFSGLTNWINEQREPRMGKQKLECRRQKSEFRSQHKSKNKTQNENLVAECSVSA
jgi:hypothetical protein